MSKKKREKKRKKENRRLEKLHKNIKSPAATNYGCYVWACELLEYSGNSLYHHLFVQDRCGVISFATKYFIKIYGIYSYCISQHNLLLPVLESFHTYNYGFVFNMFREIRFLRSDNYTVLYSICLSREVWRQFQVVSHSHFLWPGNFCLDSSSTFQSAVP